MKFGHTFDARIGVKKTMLGMTSGSPSTDLFDAMAGIVFYIISGVKRADKLYTCNHLRNFDKRAFI